MPDKIVCFGEVLWDMLPSGAKPGGAPLNVAVHLKRQGFSPLLISKIGRDNEGKNLRAFIEQTGISCNLIYTDPTLETSKVLVKLDQEGNATYEICEPVAWDNLIAEDNIQKAATEASIIVFGSLASRNRTTRETLLKMLSLTSGIRFLDINLRPPYVDPALLDLLLQHCDFLKLNEEELFQIARQHKKSGSLDELIRWVADSYGCRLVCVTLGSKGAVLFCNNHIYRNSGFKVRTVDTVGAGDSFLAALIAGLFQNKEPESALEYACATGALVASRPGAVPEYTHEEIEGMILNAKV